MGQKSSSLRCWFCDHSIITKNHDQNWLYFDKTALAQLSTARPRDNYWSEIQTNVEWINDRWENWEIEKIDNNDDDHISKWAVNPQFKKAFI